MSVSFFLLVLVMTFGLYTLVPTSDEIPVVAVLATLQDDDWPLATWPQGLFGVTNPWLASRLLRWHHCSVIVRPPALAASSWIYEV